MSRFLQGALVIMGFTFAGPALGQDDSKEPVGERIRPADHSAIKGGEPGWQPPASKSYTAEEIRKECAKYNNQFIGFYSKVFKVENCKRREVSDEYLDSKSGRRAQVKAVENDTLIKIPPGEPLDVKSMRQSCKSLENRYFISPSDEMFVMESCQLRAFADYETFEDHARKRRRSKSNVLELTGEDLTFYQQGAPIETILDAVFSQETVVETEVDVIPLSEACRGLNGTFVSYYSKVYKIENCRKRELENPTNHRQMLSRAKIKELSSEQWISLPSGKAI